MDGGKRRAALRDALDAAVDRIVDVEKLHVEEDALSGPPQFVDQRQPAGEDKLHADLEEARAVAEPLDQRRASLTLATSSATIIRSRASRG